VHFAPAWPERYGSLVVGNLRLAGRSASLTVGSGIAHLSGLGPEIDVVPRPRAPLSAVGEPGAAGRTGTAGQTGTAPDTARAYTDS
jgi:hypothetical protein